MSAILILLLGTILLFISVKYIWQYPDFFFWLFLMLLFDPSGYFTIYFDKASWGGLYYGDLFMVLCFIPFFSPKVDKTPLWRDGIFKWLLGIQLIFMLYHLFIYGWIVPGHSADYFLRFVLIRERTSIFGFIILIPAFIFCLRRVGLLIDMLVFISFGVYFVHYIDLLAGTEMLPIMSFERYEGSGIMRYSLESTGISEFTIPLAMYLFFTKTPYKYKNFLYLTAAMVFGGIVLALTKSVFITLAALMSTVFYILYKWFNYPISNLIKKGAFFLLLLISVLLVTFPKYIEYAARLGEDIYLIATGQPYTSGEVEARLNNQVPAHLSIIREAPFFGAGASNRDYVSLKFDETDYDVTDLPITGHIAYFGFLGMALYSILYVLIIRLLIKISRFVKRQMSLDFVMNHQMELIMIVLGFGYFVKSFIFRPNYLFVELAYGRMIFNFFIAMLIAAYYRLRVSYFNENNRIT